jgi:hypothetical protein
MGVIVKPKNLNDRQMKRVDKIESPERARTVASRISARRDARGAENPQIAKAIQARRTMTQPMKKGGMKKKYKHGGTVSMQLGSYTRQIGKNYTGKNVVNKGAKAKMGKSVGKCKYGC